VRAPGAVTGPFRHAEIPRPRSWLGRLLRVRHPNAPRVEIQNLLAAKPLPEVTRSEVDAILTRHCVNLSRRRDVLLKLWRQALRQFLRDDSLSDKEVDYLAGLRHLFALTDRDVERAHIALAEPRYAEAFSEAVADEKLTPEELARLEKLAVALRLPERARRKAQEAPIQEIVERVLARVVADRRLSPAEEQALRDLQKNLGIPELRFGPATQMALDKYALLWRIENGELPFIAGPAPTPLQEGELCHLACRSFWHELRNYTARTERPGGAAPSVKVPRGLTYRVDGAVPKRVLRDGLAPVDWGSLYVTSCRLVFIGQKTRETIRFNELVGIEVFADAIVLEKTSGRRPHLFLEGDVEVIAAVVSEVMAHA
jgi:envelope transporter Tic110